MGYAHAIFTTLYIVTIHVQLNFKPHPQNAPSESFDLVHSSIWIVEDLTFT